MASAASEENSVNSEAVAMWFLPAAWICGTVIDRLHNKTQKN